MDTEHSTPPALPTPFDIHELASPSYPLIYIAGWLLLAAGIILSLRYFYLQYRLNNSPQPQYIFYKTILAEIKLAAADTTTSTQKLKSMLSLLRSTKQKILPEHAAQLNTLLFQENPNAAELIALIDAMIAYTEEATES